MTAFNLTQIKAPPRPRAILSVKPQGGAAMLQLFLIVHIFVGSTVVGVAVIAALSMGLDTLQPLLGAAALGFVAAIPVSWIVTKRVLGEK